MRKILLALVLLFTLPAQAEQLDHVIVVNGIGEVEVPVDNVTINLGINTRGKNVAKAKEENQDKYAAILQIITKKFGLGKDAIKSNFVSINPNYVYCNQPQTCDSTKIDFYEVQRSLEIKLTDLDKYDALISALSQSASYVNTGRYDVAEKTKYKDQARDLAIESAKAKAEKIAKKLEVKLGKPAHFESFDDSENSYRPVPMMAKMANAEATSAPTDTETLGKIKVSITVNIAYQIE